MKPNSQVTRLAVLMVLVVVVFSALSPSVFPTALNFQSMGYSVPEIAALALAVALAMRTGGIDLSIVATANLAAIAAARFYLSAGGESATGAGSLVAALAIALAVGLACGAVNGVLVARVGISPILATLATMQVFNGAAVLWTGGKAQYGLPDTFLQLGTLTIALVPVSLLLTLLATALLWWLVNRTGLGMRITLVGANAVAGRYSGIDERGVLLRTYLLSGLLAGLAGILIAAKSASASPDYGGSYVLLAIVIAVLGGTDPAGGKGSIIGVVLAALTLQMLESGFNILRINPLIYQIVQGLVLLVVMVLELRRGRLSHLFGGLSVTRRRV
ncbi:ABC transporter permease [Pseudonocardia acaciae]|uniref:ABC transporter permease n=1 Tax=Pseudonocardia acaciae TaxID=551276 RepID=UPI000686F91E|nr:ABC transporter permease [Pseudonocardia acaciae]